MTEDFQGMASELFASIKLGYEAEAEDPNFGFEPPSDVEARWLAAWLVSEGWTRPGDWVTRSARRP